MVNLLPESFVRWWNKFLYKLTIPTITGAQEQVVACSFCRGEPMLMQVDCGPNGKKRAIRCCTCGMVGPLTLSPGSAISAWNQVHANNVRQK